MAFRGTYPYVQFSYTYSYLHFCNPSRTFSNDPWSNFLFYHIFCEAIYLPCYKVCFIFSIFFYFPDIAEKENCVVSAAEVKEQLDVLVIQVRDAPYLIFDSSPLHTNLSTFSAYTHALPLTHTYMHADTDMYLHSRIHRCIQAYTDTHIQTAMYLHSHKYTYMYTQTDRQTDSPFQVFSN